MTIKELRRLIEDCDNDAQIIFRNVETGKDLSPWEWYRAGQGAVITLVEAEDDEQ